MNDALLRNAHRGGALNPDSEDERLEERARPDPLVKRADDREDLTVLGTNDPIGTRELRDERKDDDSRDRVALLRVRVEDRISEFFDPPIAVGERGRPAAPPETMTLLNIAEYVINGIIGRPEKGHLWNVGSVPTEIARPVARLTRKSGRDAPRDMRRASERVRPDERLSRRVLSLHDRGERPRKAVPARNQSTPPYVPYQSPVSIRVSS